MRRLTDVRYSAGAESQHWPQIVAAPVAAATAVEMVAGDGMGDHAEDNDDVGDGGGINSASISIARRFGSALSSFATRVAAILHILGRGGADAGTGAVAGVGAVGRHGAGRVALGCGGVAFGCGSVVVGIGGVASGGGGAAVGSGGSRVFSRGMNRLH